MSLNPIVDSTSRGGSLARTLTSAPRVAARRSLAAEALGFLSSLKLTVGLMIVAVFVILTFTFQLTRMDIWQAKSLHFPHWVVYIPLQTFFPPKWFPDWQSVPGGFFIPSGFLILSAMLVNLIAAHLSRFRVAGTRRQVQGGTILLVGGTALAAAAIWNAQNPQGFQTEPPIPWVVLWNFIQAGLALASAACLYLGFRLPRERIVERVVLFGGGFLIAALFTFLAIRGSAAFIGDSAMRILWQLLQCVAPSIVILIGARQIFGRKAGMVMIHAGIAILMLNEIYTSTFTIEQRIQFFEGEKVNYAMDLREAELAIVDLSDPAHEDHVVIPATLLVPNQLIQDPQLPVDLMVLSYFRNSRIDAGGDAPHAVATRGVGRIATLREVPAASGTADEVDQAGAYVKLFDKQSRQEIGTFLLSQAVSAIEEDRLDDPTFPANVFELGDRRYHVALRFRRYYKPYTLTLLDTEKTSYLGTETARSYSSQFRLTDPETGIDVSEKIWMNNPLRYRNETFYQANYDIRGGRELSELQVVQNSGWMIPYFCCVLVGIGLVVQFGQTLVGYTRKLDQQIRREALVSKRQVRWLLCLWLIPLALVMWGASKGMREPPERNGMDIGGLSRAPVVHLGRSKPLDSVARSFVRRSSGVETVQLTDDRATRIDAIHWLADLVFHGSAFENYPLFRIDDPHLRNGLNLEPRKGYRYSLAEVTKSEAALQKIYDEAIDKPDEQRTTFDQRAIKLTQLVYESRELGKLFESQWDGQNVLGLYYWYAVPEQSRERAILVAPLPGKQEPWGSIHLGLFCQEMMSRAESLDAKTVDELAERIVQTEKGVVRDYVIRLQLMQGLANDERIRAQAGGLSQQQWQKLVFDQVRNAPLEDLEKMSGSIIGQIDQRMDSILQDHAQQIASDLERWLGSKNLAEVGTVYDCRRLLEMGAAYRADDAPRFNQELGAYLGAIKSTPPAGFAVWKRSWETFYNRLSPYYLATICYLLGFLLTVFSWMAWPGWFSRAASAAILGGWILHVTGILLTIGISGRAPVTGLYSSFLFVSMIVVGVFLIVERLGRTGTGNLLGSFLGVGGLLWAWNIALGTEDTFAVLVAVLDTNFWLSTHVICVILGYSATVVAGALGAIFLLNPVLRPLVLIFGLSAVGYLLDHRYGTGVKLASGGVLLGLAVWLYSMLGQGRRSESAKGSSADRSAMGSVWSRHLALLSAHQRQELPRLIYGTVCFGLLFSFVGTVLGGLWADDSWGRFWGWDPKENGALMIVLWNAVVLHARWGGIVRQRGLAGLAVLGTAVTLWSWEGVNQLGVGLHAYALSDAAKFRMLVIIWFVIFLTAALALIPSRAWWSDTEKGKPRVDDDGIALT